MILVLRIVVLLVFVFVFISVCVRVCRACVCGVDSYNGSVMFRLVVVLFVVPVLLLLVMRLVGDVACLVV